MKFKFIGVPGERHESLNMFGVAFPLGEAIEIEGKGAEKLKGHPHFEVEVEMETKVYADGTAATGPAPLPDHSPGEQAKRGPGRPKKG